MLLFYIALADKTVESEKYFAVYLKFMGKSERTGLKLYKARGGGRKSRPQPIGVPLCDQVGHHIVQPDDSLQVQSKRT